MTPPSQLPPVTPKSVGLLTDLLRQLRLIWRLYFDPRVPLWIKTIPTLTLVYMISPVDFITDLAFPLGVADDVGVILLGLATFINLCPPDIVQEHMQAIMGETGWRVVPPEPPAQPPPSESKVIEAPYTVESEKNAPQVIASDSPSPTTPDSQTQ